MLRSLTRWSQALLRREQADHVRRVLADLPADAAWLLVTKYVDGESIAALATRTGAGLETVRSKLARARRLFRQALSRAPRPVEAMRKASDD